MKNVAAVERSKALCCITGVYFCRNIAYVEACSPCTTARDWNIGCLAQHCCLVFTITSAMLLLSLYCCLIRLCKNCFYLQIPGVLSLIDDITLGPYSIMDADHLDPHIAGEKITMKHDKVTNLTM